MAKHDVMPLYPGIMDHAAHCRNGMPTSGTLARWVANAHNFISAYQRKMVFTKSMVDSVPASQAALQTPWHFRFHAGYNASEIVFDMLLASASSVAGTDPLVYWDVTEVGVGTVATDEYHYGAEDGSPPDYPDGYTHAQIRYTLPTKNQTYECGLNLEDYARVAACTAYTTGATPVDDTLAGNCDPRLGVDSPILDKDLSGVLAAGTNLWQRNGVHLFSWSRDTAATAPTHTGATYTNPFDSSTGNPTAATWGQRVVTAYHNSYSQTTIPCRVAFRAKRTAGAGTTANNKIQLIDTGGTTYAEVTGINDTVRWYGDTSVPWPAGTTKFDVQMITDAADTVRLDAICLYTYE